VPADWAEDEVAVVAVAPTGLADASMVPAAFTWRVSVPPTLMLPPEAPLTSSFEVEARVMLCPTMAMLPPWPAEKADVADSNAAVLLAVTVAVMGSTAVVVA
jgi:hypothetical protein